MSGQENNSPSPLLLDRSQLTLTRTAVRTSLWTRDAMLMRSSGWGVGASESEASVRNHSVAGRRVAVRATLSTSAYFCRGWFVFCSAVVLLSSDWPGVCHHPACGMARMRNGSIIAESRPFVAKYRRNRH